MPAVRPRTKCSRPLWVRSCLQGQWSLALHELFQAYHLAKEEPLVLLCLGVALLQKSMSRKAEDRNKTILQAFAFMQVGSATQVHSSIICAAFCRVWGQVCCFHELLSACNGGRAIRSACCWIPPFQEVTAASCVWHLHACL